MIIRALNADHRDDYSWHTSLYYFDGTSPTPKESDSYYDLWVGDVEDVFSIPCPEKYREASIHDLMKFVAKGRLPYLNRCVLARAGHGDYRACIFQGRFLDRVDYQVAPVATPGTVEGYTYETYVSYILFVRI